MPKIKWPSIDRFSLGFKFSEDRENLALVYINYFVILIFSVVVVLLHTAGEELVPVSYRYHALILFSFIELWLMRMRFIALARILMLTIIPIALLILPPFAGITDNEFYFWFPYVPIALSIIPHFILHTIRHRVALIFTLVVYMCLSLLIDNYLIYFSDGSEEIIPIVIENRFYYNLIPIFIFLFVNIALGLLFARNHRYEMIMQLQQEDLLQAEKMVSLGTLTAGIAHEINNPLNFISGSLNALNTLKEKIAQEEEGVQKEHEEIYLQMDQVIKSAFEGVTRAEEIITKLSFFSNPELKDREETDLEPLIKRALLGIESKLPYNIELNLDIPSDLKIYCHAQPLRLVFSHILRNAIDALESMETKERETIEIVASKEKIDRIPHTRITFRNSGPAIPEKDLKHIFDPFFSSKEAGKGEGLGMSLSYMIVQEHGGRIDIRNLDGKVNFDVLLPEKGV